MVNSTLSYLYGRTPLCVMNFSGVTGTASVHLNDPGGLSGDGFPLPRSAILSGLEVWDGARRFSDSDTISLVAGDRLSVFCQNQGTTFTVKVRVNGTSTALEVAAVPHNSTLFVSVEYMLKRT